MSSAALKHIEERGSLLGFAGTRQERLVLMKAVLRQGLIVWNITRGKYELTTFGHKRLDEYRHKIATGV
jgi:hypothetical protein